MSLNSPEYLALAAEIAKAETDITQLGATLKKITAEAGADTALTAAGFLPPPAGTAADLISLGKDLAAGDWGGAFWSAVGIIPIVGDAAKVAGKGAKVANKMSDLQKALDKARDVVKQKQDELAKMCKDKQVKNKNKVTDKAENCGKGDCGAGKKPLKKVDVPCFKKNTKGDPKEFDRQLKDQEDGLNNLTAEEYKKGRDAYGASNRNSTEKARNDYKKGLVKDYQKNGMSKDDATKLAESKMKTLNALHNPDLIAGGKDVTTTFGDAGVNKSIGSQWKKRVGVLDKEADDAIERGEGKAKMNAKLKRCK